jgi:hypothetical protein
MTQQQYRITNGPCVLSIGLLCLLAASVVTFTIAAHASKTASTRPHRQVNVVRLLVDSVLGLKIEKNNSGIDARNECGLVKFNGRTRNAIFEYGCDKGLARLFSRKGRQPPQHIHPPATNLRKSFLKQLKNL